MAFTNSITKSAKSPRGYDVQGAKFLYVADGIQPPLELIPAWYLPVVEEDKLQEAWFVIKAGKIVALDRTLLNGETLTTTNRLNLKWLVLANGGAAQSITYAASDVGTVIDIDQLEAGDIDEVPAAATPTKQVAANFPAGFAPYNYYSSAHEKIYHNFKLQNTVGFITRGHIEIPLEYDTGATSVTQATLEVGHLVKPGANGEPVKFVHGSHSVDQIVGRAVQVLPISVVDALDKVLTVPGFRLPGTGTSGKQLHEDTNLVGTSNKVTRKVRINITLA